MNRPVAAHEFGEWTWLRVFDADDLRAFVEEIREAVTIGVHEESSGVLDEQLRAWRMTAQQAMDPLRRAILRGPVSEDDFVEVERPRRPAAPSGDESA